MFPCRMCCVYEQLWVRWLSRVSWPESIKPLQPDVDHKKQSFSLTYLKSSLDMRFTNNWHTVQHIDFTYLFTCIYLSGIVFRHPEPLSCLCHLFKCLGRSDIVCFDTKHFVSGTRRMLKKTPRLSRRGILSRINSLKWDKYHGPLEGDWTFSGTITLATSV